MINETENLLMSIKNSIIALHIVIFIIFNFVLFSINSDIHLNKIIIFIILNFLIIFLLMIFLLYIKNKVKNFDRKMNEAKLIDFKKFENSLENKIIQTIAENLHHEIKTPLMSMKTSLYRYKILVEILTKIINEKNWHVLEILSKKVVKNKLDCLTCPDRGKNGQCEYFVYFNKDISRTNEELYNIVDSSIQNIFKTISITKTLKSIKNTEKQLSVFDVIQQSTIIFSMTIKYKINYEIDEEFKKCYLDEISPNVFLNILLNHIKNSVEAQAGLIRFKFENYFEKKQNSKKFIKVKIIDNGDGIPEEMQNKIYEIHQSTKSKEKNTRGVGLYLTKNILNYYGGDEKLVYSSSKGTIFELIIPIKKCVNIKKEVKDE